ncbi:MAG: YtxH domain-containing protein [Jaaginema sp. PMC 1079.18]|nr:YtxH domain-containing protein [Jaaginema sp. PMC 1080.18]MEC4852301.1 YtxH domain-containing protein [Jaaginema sp. PMC 1079.18]MEC4866612.1 YtxH domain-containing protein [Jaaginema sp. PMC 1078.18]
MAKSRTGTFFGGMLIGTAVGTVVGMLIAPRPGRETRQILKKSAAALPELAEDLSTSLQLQADRFSESALHNWNDTLIRLQEAIAAGVYASQLKTKELQQTHELTDASASVNHHS